MNLNKMPFIVLFIALLYGMFDPLIASAQTGSVEAWVVDPNGAIISDAKIAATFVSKNPLIVTDREFPFTVDESGVFTFRNLPVGIYVLRATIPWSKITPRALLQVYSKVNTKVELVLKSPSKACVTRVLGSPKLSENDRAEAVRRMLRIKIKSDPMLAEIVRQGKKLILSEKNIKRSWLDSKLNSYFKLERQNEIQNRADTDKDFKYFVFSKLLTKGNCVAISLDHIWAVGKNSNFVYLDGSGNTYEFRKVNDKWVSIFVFGWIA